MGVIHWYIYLRHIWGLSTVLEDEYAAMDETKLYGFTSVSCGAKTIKWLAACTGLCTVSHPVYHPPAAFSHASWPWLSLPTQAFAFTVCSLNGTVYLWNEIFVRSLLKKEWGILHFWFGFLPCFLHQCHWGNSSSSQVQEDRISKYYINNIFVYLSDRRDDNFSTIRAFMQLHRLLLRTEDI